MAPSHSRLLVWTLPTIAVLFSYLWYKKRRCGPRSDSGGGDITDPPHTVVENVAPPTTPIAALHTPQRTPDSATRTFSRSLSGVDSAPIDIVIPPELRSTKTSPVVISDEDLDLEIEKIKSMKNVVTCCVQEEAASVGAPPQLPPGGGAKSKRNRKKTAKKLVMTVDEKMAGLTLNGERDSANHSPVDVMLASPSLSCISDNHSEGSNDSGKGGSDVATPPPSTRTPNESTTLDTPSQPTLYEFIIPQGLVGMLIGRHGSFVSNIKQKTNAHIVVKKHPSDYKLKICSIDGTAKEIEHALRIIRDKFPAKQFPALSLDQICVTTGPVALMPDHLYLKLIEGINNDTIMSCMVAPNHLFVQQPTHPSFPNLNLLSNCMNSCYQDSDSPNLPTPVPDNTICAVYSVDSWYRAMVLSSDPESDTSYVKFLDCGGFANVEHSKLKLIRGDFMLLPFQAAECILARIKSVYEDGSWSEEAYNLVASITNGTLMYTQVDDYTEEGVPLVLCYVVVGPQQIVFLNEHLVQSGFAHWIEPHYEEFQPQTQKSSDDQFSLRPLPSDGAGGILA